MDSPASGTRTEEQLAADGHPTDPWPRRSGVSRTELDPVSFLARSASLHPDRVAVVHGELRRTYEELDARVRRLASALRARGLRRRDRVAILAPNTPALLNQGITRGSEAWSNAMRDFDSGRNDAYQQAILAGINTMPQTQALAMGLRNQPLNELNAIRSGSQVTNPAFGNTPQQATTPGADLLGAANAAYGGQLNAYNTQVGQQNATQNSLMQGALMAALYMSDRRLKSNIRPLGNDGRHNWYEYTLFGRREIAFSDASALPHPCQAGERCRSQVVQREAHNITRLG